MSDDNRLVSLPEYISDSDRDEAYYFIKMLLESLALKLDTKTGVIDGFKVVLTYNKTKLKRESDLKIDYNNKLYSLKFLHSKLNHYSDLETNFLVAFVLNHKKQIEDFII
ncbi:MAG: hypothetical protein J6C55_03850 [Oscillospiraceae bacterium]|nr:hypothetical protein [Oscillospiraceae bacterium]